MTSGNVSTGSNTLTLGTSASSLGTLSHPSATANSIVGNFKRWFAASTVAGVLLPVGISSSYRPATIGFTGAPSAGGTLVAAFVASNPGVTGLPLTDGGTSIVNCGVNGYWRLTAGDGLSGGTYSLDLTARGFTNVSVVSTLRILKRSNASSPWTLNGTHAAGTGTVAIPVVHRTAMSGFSEFGIGGASDNPLPIQLSRFGAVAISSTQVRLEWATVSETNNYGFQVQKSPNQPDVFQTLANSFVPGHGTTNEPHEYTFTDNAASPGIWYYRLEQIDLDGATHYSDPVQVDVLTSVEDQNAPLAFSLKQNYPNPFNPSTLIRYSVASTEHVSLKVYDMVGRAVATLVDEVKAPGAYAISWNASGFPSGTYVYRLEGGTSKETKRMTLLK